MDQYKSQVLSCIDYTTAAVYHAPAFYLQSIDKEQEDFLNELGLSALNALESCCTELKEHALNYVELLKRGMIY